MPILTQQPNSETKKILEVRHHDPFAFLGKHPLGKNEEIVRIFMPAVSKVTIMPGNLLMERIPNTD